MEYRCESTHINADAGLREDARIGVLFRHKAKELLGAVVPLQSIQRLGGVKLPMAAQRSGGPHSHRLWDRDLHFVEA